MNEQEEQKQATGEETMTEVNKEKQNEVDALLEERPHWTEPVPFGFPSLEDAMGGGLRPGLVVLGSEYSMGKTTFALNMASNIITLSGRDVIYISVVGDRKEIPAKIISQRGNLSKMKFHSIDVTHGKSNIVEKRLGVRSTELLKTELDILRGDIDKKEEQDFLEKIEPHLYCPKVKEDYKLSYLDVDNIIKTYIAAFPNKERPVVFIDFLQVMTAPNDNVANNEFQIIAENMHGLRTLCEEYKVCIFAISMINRAYSGKPACYEGFYGTRQIEYSANTILRLQNRKCTPDWLEERDRNPQKRELDIVVLKSANSAPNSQKGIPFDYYPAWNVFVDKTFEESKIDNLNLIEKDKDTNRKHSRR